MTKPPPTRSRRPARKDEPATPRRGGPARSISMLLPEVGGVAFARFGFNQSELISRWSDIVGPQYARWSVPQTLRYARGQKTGGTLHIRVEGPFAPQLQHAAPQIIERVNRIFGHAAVGHIKLVQGPVPRAPARAPAQLPADTAPASSACEAPSANLRAIADPDLRLALEELARQLGRTRGLPTVR